ncbi:MAG: hypothetical protein ALECFALPRED_010423 [Alectoria fallacina]|uniref:Uncharacterized protein n=1 Tax=Alectoria fallacina TaxID=1903189 RepID=A0A8H3J9C9_9LECA|nr:MAG: hypothetical protein ALECFALPRED_010423 [Alectoria fallacina]
MLYITAIAAFPIVCLSATFFTIVTSLTGVTPQKEVNSDDLAAAVEVQSGLPDESIAVTVHEYLAGALTGSSNKSATIKLNGHNYVLPTDLPSAIPPYLENCEFFYNTADMDLFEKSKLLLEGNLKMARLTMDG